MPVRVTPRPIFYVVLLLALLLPLSAVAAQEDDSALLSAAWQRLDAARSLLFAFDLSLAVDAPDSSGELNLSGSGAASDGDTPALSVALDGGMVAGGETTPLNLEARVVAGVLYFKTSQMPNWSGLRLDELMPLAENMVLSNYQSGFTGSPDAADPSDPAAQAAMAELTDLLASLDLSAYATTERLADETVDGETLAHFRTTVAVDALAQSPEIIDLFIGLAKLGNPAAVETVTDNDRQQIRAMLSQAFGKTALSAEYYVNADSSELRRAILLLDLTIDPNSFGQRGESVGVLVQADVRLTDYDAAPAIEAPANAAMIHDLASVMGGQQAEPTFGPTTPTPTPVATEDAAPAPQGAQSISANVPAQIRVSAAGPTDLIYTSPGNETISVVAHSLEEPGTVDTTLEVLTASGTRLAFNDDHGGSRSGLHAFDSAIEELRLTDAGDYIIRVTTFSGAAEGNVEVLVESGANGKPTTGPVAATPTPTSAQVQITGETDRLASEVPEGSHFTYYFNATAGQVMTLTIRADQTSDLDPRVTLYGPDGTELASNDDHQDNDPTLSSFDSRISNFALPVDGRYSAVISGFAGTGGPFELEMTRSNPDGTQPAMTPTTATALGQEQVINDQIESNGGYVYTLDASAGDVYTFTARAVSGNLDPQVYIYDSSDNLIAANDDHSSSDRSLGQFDARIQNLIFQQSGTYTVEVYGYSDTAGGFALIITPVATGAPTGPGQQAVETGTLQSRGSFTTTFDAQAGDYVTVTARALSGDLDPQLAVLDPSGRLVADNDDHHSVDSSLGTFDSKIQNILITRPGTYTIEVRGYADTSGSVAVTTTTLR